MNTWLSTAALPVAIALAVLSVGAVGFAQAREITCDNTSEFACGYALRDVALQRGSPVFRFQSRISQAKLPSGSGSFKNVVVKLLRGLDALCVEEIANVAVSRSILNLEIGRNMSCELDEVIAENDNLAFQVCPGGADSCLKPVALATAAYAIKSDFAERSQRAQSATISARANYAMRASADRELFLRDSLATGYFDFYTHPASDAEGLYDTDTYNEKYASSGFFQWASVREPDIRKLTFSGKNHASGLAVRLSRAGLESRKTLILGDLSVAPDTADGRLVLAGGGGAAIIGSSDIDNDLVVRRNLNVENGDATIGSSAVVGGDFTSGAQLTVVANGATVAGDLALMGGLFADGGAAVGGSVSVAADGKVVGTLSATGLSASTLIATTATVDGATEVGALTVGGVASVVGELSGGSVVARRELNVGGNATLTESLRVKGPVIFGGDVEYRAGSDGWDLDFVLANGETRELGFGGRLRFAGGLDAASDVELNGIPVTGMRIGGSFGPSLFCDEGTEGAVFFDRLDDSVKVCVAGQYVPLGTAPLPGDYNNGTCGDFMVTSGEECDDGGTLAGDGCNGSCLIEAGWLCGLGAPTVCNVAACGDNIAVGGEECDDGNNADGDGCDFNCGVEPGWTCDGQCVATRCGDGFSVDNEACDDGNNLVADGCDALCNVEAGWICDGSVPNSCTSAACGDAIVAGGETCDDGNTQNDDGCDATCQIEDGWLCAADIGDTRSFCSVAGCGDGFAVGFEVCDDGNTYDGDGCSWDCNFIEIGWACDVDTPNNCQAAGCGDGLVAGYEECDDDNLWNGDGCSVDCVAELGWTCDGGSPTSCIESACGDGYRVGDEDCDDGNSDWYDGCGANCLIEGGWDCFGDSPTTCDVVGCGDGFRVAHEACDDGNPYSGDGCSSACGVELGWNCYGSVNSVCYAAACGDGLRAGREICDDGNRDSWDGCDYYCGLETGWTCDPGSPEVCRAAACGDGNWVGPEGCDDGDRYNGDGCDSSCRVEAGWECHGSPSDCSPVGFSVEFFGDDEIIDVGPVEVLEGTTSYSVAAWAKFDSLTTSATVFAKRTSNDDRATVVQLFDTSGKMAVGVNNGYCRTTGRPVSTGQWYHFLLSYTGSNWGVDRLEFYVNGVQQGLTNCDGDIPTSTPSTKSRFTIGGEYNGMRPVDDRWSWWFGSEDVKVVLDGHVTDVAIWNAFMYANEPAALYNAGRVADPRSNFGAYVSQSYLKHYWTFTEGDGDTLEDVKGGANGVLENSPSWSNDVPGN